MWKWPLFIAAIGFFAVAQKACSIIVVRMHMNQQGIHPLGPVTVIDDKVIDILIGAFVGATFWFIVLLLLGLAWRGVKRFRLGSAGAPINLSDTKRSEFFPLLGWNAARELKVTRPKMFGVVLTLVLGLLVAAQFLSPAVEDHAHGLLSLGLGPQDHDRWVALNAVAGDNVDGLRRALRRGVSPNSRYNSPATLLGNAVEAGSYNAAALLLS
jgi:hypothetical protein